jgi:MFS family permease
VTATTLPSLSARRRWTVLAVCCLSLFLVGLDTTIVNVGLPAIGRGLGAGTRSLEWTVNAYTLMLAGLLISSGALADRFGRRRVFQLGLATFGAASLVCALAPSVGSLIATFGWRSVFWINAPVIAAALVLSAVFVPESRAPRARRLDIPGQVLLAVVVAVSVGVLIEGPRIGWTSVATLIAYALVAIVTAGFAMIELRRREPLMDLRLFRRPAFSSAVLGAVAVFVALNVTLLLNTYYLQHTRGCTPLVAGVATLPLAAGATICAPWSGRLVGRRGPRPPLVLAGAFTTLGALCLVGLDQHTSLSVLLLAYALIGIGFGFANAPITNTAVSGLPPTRAGVAGAITSTARQLGSALGIALAGGLVAGVPPADLASASRPGWILVAACGLLMFLVAIASRPK